MTFTCGIKGSLQSLQQGLDFRHVFLQGLTIEERVDFGSFMPMLTIHCHQPGKAMVHWLSGKTTTIEQQFSKCPQNTKSVFKEAFVALDIFNTRIYPP